MRWMRKALIAFFFFAATTVQVWAQNDIVQFSGVVLGGDSLNPIPYASLMIKGSNRGTVSDYFGYFSLVAETNDTVEFSSVGYKKAYFIIPDSLTSNRYSLIQLMTNDTIVLSETVVYPWPSKEQFKEAFLSLRVPEDDYDRAMKNLASAELRDRAAGMPADGGVNYKYQMQRYQSKLYYAGQYPPNNLLNPIAWAKFIQAWKDGEFRRKDKDQ